MSVVVLFWDAVCLCAVRLRYVLCSERFGGICLDISQGWCVGPIAGNSQLTRARVSSLASITDGAGAGSEAGNRSSSELIV